MKLWLTIISGFFTTTSVASIMTPYEIPIESQGSRTFYVQSTIHGSGKSMLLIDTGSGHSVINEETLAELISSGNATFLKNLKGMMADGSTRVVPLYRVSAITIGNECVIKNVEAAVLPNSTRQILGISALQKTAPFSLSFDPPRLSLSKCGSSESPTTGEGDKIPEEIPAATPVESEKEPDSLQAEVTTGNILKY